MNKKHMTLEDRYTIYQMLNDGVSFKKIADAINKNPSLGFSTIIL